MIDELERVRRFRGDETPPSDAARQEASAALARAIGASRAQPQHARGGAGERTSGAAGERTSDTAGERALGAASERRPWRRRRWLPRMALGVVVVAACLIAIDLAGSGPDTGPSPALAAALARLAQIAAGGPSLVPGPGQYLYVDSRNDYPADAIAGHQSCVTYATDHRQVWIGANGSGLLQDTTGRTMFTSAHDRAICTSMHLGPSTSTSTSTSSGPSRLWFAARCFELGPGNDMQALSTNPPTLLRQMRRIDGGPPGPGEDFVHVGDFLRETDASPALRAALYRAAALIPGVHLLGTVRDHLGRRGLGVAYDSHGVRHELIFDAQTAALMGEQDVGGAPGTGSWAVYLASRVVDRVPRRAPIPLSPPCVNGGGYVTHTPLGDVQTGRRPDS